LRKLLFLLSSLLVSFSTCYAEATPKESPKQELEVQKAEKRKKLLILSCAGGYGHIAATNTLVELFKDKYSLQVIYPIDELRILGVPSGESLYNKMISTGWIRTVNFVSRYIAPNIFYSKKERIEEIVQNHIERENPDLIVSVIPFINYPASEAARKRAVPYLLITTDNDLNNWVHDLEYITHPNFEVTIGADLPSSRDLLQDHNISDEKIKTIGLPLRSSFTKSKNLAELQNAYGISSDKPVVLIMMGGAGSKQAYKYTKMLSEMDLSIQLIAIAGKNKDLYNQMKKLKPHVSNSLLVLSFTENIADVMALSDVLITKPGPGTINEAISMKLPVLLDTSSTPLFWEKVNSELVKQYRIGEVISKKRKLPRLLEKYLFDGEFREEIAISFNHIPENSFEKDIEPIIENLIEGSSLVQNVLKQARSNDLTAQNN
jgi:UDP-N-acetylglucosamine:LPS N-acetylglucosamine transferase